jgi:propanol-preferring alcohol dehydrogenase
LIYDILEPNYERSKLFHDPLLHRLYPPIQCLLAANPHVGIIDQLWSKSKNWKVGQRVGVGWHGGHCFQCPACRSGEFGACEDSSTTGITTDGGYAEFMVACMETLNSLPDNLDPVEAAPLLCAGRTTFGALQNCVAKGDDLVAIHGLGGLGHLGLQFAIKLGFETAVLSRGREKEMLARKLGAHHFIDTNTSDAAKELMNLVEQRLSSVRHRTARPSPSLSPAQAEMGR